MKISQRHISGYVLPVAMAIISILTFTMLGVMETSQVEEKKSSDEQYRRLVEQVARSELKSQHKYVEKNKGLLRRSRNSNLPENLFTKGCVSTDKEAICQSVTLNYLGDFPKPEQLQRTIPRAEFVGRRFRITSKAEHKRSGAVAEMNMDLKHAELEIWLRRDIPDFLGKHPDRDQLISILEFYIPEWWELTILSPWRIGCVTPSFSVLAILTSFLTVAGFLLPGAGTGLSAALIAAGVGTGAAGGFESGNILFQASCVVKYIDRQGIARHWDSGILSAGSIKVFIVPEGSRSVQHYWQANVAGRAAGYTGFWEWGIVKWWSVKQATWSLPEPLDFCRVAHGDSESPKFDACPFGMVENTQPIIGP